MINHQIINNQNPFIIFKYHVRDIYVRVNLQFFFSLTVIHVLQLIKILLYDLLTRY
jgi:hypothetical protein